MMNLGWNVSHKIKGQIMKHLISLMFVLGFSLAQFSCSKSETFDELQVRKSIKAACTKYSQAIREENLPGVLDIYTTEATIIPPDGEMVWGKQAIEEMYKKLLQKGMKDIVFNTIEVGGSGDTAYEIGKTKVQIHPEGQAAFTDTTKYLVIWKRQADNTWKIHVSIWNFSTLKDGK